MAFDSRVEKWLDGVAASNLGDSGWEIVALDDDCTIHIFGLGAGDEVKVQGSNEDSPSNPIDLATLSGTDDIVRVQDGIRKVRVNVTADGSNGSNITAIAHKRKRQ